MGVLGITHSSKVKSDLKRLDFRLWKVEMYAWAHPAHSFHRFIVDSMKVVYFGPR